MSSSIPFPYSLMGVDPNREHDQVRGAPSNEPSALVVEPTEERPRRSGRAMSYHNAFQTEYSISDEDPPNYSLATRRGSVPQLPESHGQEDLPEYYSSVNAEVKVLVNVESVSPLDAAVETEWREIYLVLRGTLLSFYRVKDGGAGRLVKRYTLQHAEVGLAPDVQHTVLVPRTRLASLVPNQMRRRASQRDPDMFRVVPQTVMRLRVETDQLLLADASDELIFALIQLISAGIDLSPALDERSLPRQCTMPRRRRRARPRFEGNIEDPTLVAEQERIFRERYPSFATPVSPSQSQPQDPALPPTIREEDELDLAAMREDGGGSGGAASMPNTPSEETSDPLAAAGRQARSASLGAIQTPDMVYETSAANFDPSGKWQPPHRRNPVQVQRYVRRCMPVLLADARRASDVLIRDGRRVKVNWRMELLEDWEARPPSYRAHDFGESSSSLPAASTVHTAAAGAGAGRMASVPAIRIDTLSPTATHGSIDDNDFHQSLSNYSVSASTNHDPHAPPSPGSTLGGGGDLEPISPTCTDPVVSTTESRMDFAKFASTIKRKLSFSADRSRHISRDEEPAPPLSVNVIPFEPPQLDVRGSMSGAVFCF